MSASTNLQRASWAATALQAFRHEVGNDDDATLILDLITDLGQLAKTQQMDFVAITARAVSVWAYERRHPDGMGASPQLSITLDGRKPKLAWSTKDTKGGAQ
jgi:hypothetical protein